MISKWLDRGDERFLSKIKDPERREKYLVQLCRSRTLDVFALFLFGGFMLLFAFSGAGIDWAAFVLVIFVSWYIVYLRTDTRIKLIQTINLLQSTPDKDKAVIN